MERSQCGLQAGGRNRLLETDRPRATPSYRFVLARASPRRGEAKSGESQVARVLGRESRGRVFWIAAMLPARLSGEVANGHPRMRS